MFQLVQNQSSGDIKDAFLFLDTEILTVRSGTNRILSTFAQVFVCRNTL